MTHQLDPKALQAAIDALRDGVSKLPQDMIVPSELPTKYTVAIGGAYNLAIATITAYLTAAQEGAEWVLVPEGMVLVPINPTGEMLTAAGYGFMNCLDKCGYKPDLVAPPSIMLTAKVWEAMIEAAPKPTDKQEMQDER